MGSSMKPQSVSEFACSEPQSISPTQSASPIPPPMNKLMVQNLRLVSELFPFKEPDKLEEWLKLDCMQGAWAEFMRDCVTKPPSESDADLDKGTIAGAAKTAIESRSIRYLVYHPDKTAWTVEDHHVRFIMIVVRDNLLRALWSEKDWQQRPLGICKAVYELLCYLKTACFIDEGPGCSS
ncbi:hypothetical protein E4U17_006187 [Claviceps sp. LM77 group G4]|nr:hypothetical protein E4U17_006187 [Claviceps sp. LM77 group G4]KAG6063513.1 hypothetical protein E4U33_006334 [Claviceps sp. LM78 group G4]KAG6071110.1 hypothetical protein E4U16_006360 [Claviceps sp. LM84 group G4]